MTKHLNNLSLSTNWQATRFVSPSLIYFNRPFDKSRLKGLLTWTLASFGEKKTIDLVEKLKQVGYSSATQAGLSLSIEDLLIPKEKTDLIVSTEAKLNQTDHQVLKGYLTSVEYLAQVIDTWNATNEAIKDQVIKNFRSKDVLNPVYMMAFSGARGNISQVRQLVGMRGLMADPSGNIIDYPIQSNFREGLTLTEYIISCYGARKGVVDTALRTATSGYLTRRLVDVAQHVIVRVYDCTTTKGIYLSALETDEKILLDGPTRLVGRVLAEDVYDSTETYVLAKRNVEVTSKLAKKLFQHQTKIFVRSALTCMDKQFVCQLCYGWSLATGRLVSVGDTVGVIAAQSIGEPGTQLTMRTFHTGGVFSGEVTKTLKSPAFGQVCFSKSIAGKCVRTTHGEIAFLTKQSGTLLITEMVYKANSANPTALLSKSSPALTPPKGAAQRLQQRQNNQQKTKKIHKLFLKPYTLLFVKQGEIVYPTQVLAEASSLSQLRQKLKTAQTIYSQIAGEVKFRQTNLVQSLYYPPHTQYAQLSATIGEFWILSAQKQTFFKPLEIFVQPGDLVEYQSPILTFFLAQIQPIDISYSICFQQNLSLYRAHVIMHCLNAYTNISSKTSQSNPPLAGFYKDKSTIISGFSTFGSKKQQTQLWLNGFHQLGRGTFIERVVPFFSHGPKQRFAFSWQKRKKYKSNKKKINQVSFAKAQKAKALKNRGFKRLIKDKTQTKLYQPISSTYAFVLKQKQMRIALKDPLLSLPCLLFETNVSIIKTKQIQLKSIAQSSFFQSVRQNDTQMLLFYPTYWTLFDQKVFLPLSCKLEKYETTPLTKNLFLQDQDSFDSGLDSSKVSIDSCLDSWPVSVKSDPFLGSFPVKKFNQFYCKSESLWKFFVLATQPTASFQQSLTSLLPKKFALTLHKKLQIQTSQIQLQTYHFEKNHPNLHFCLYYRMINHFRFQKTYFKFFLWFCIKIKPSEFDQIGFALYNPNRPYATSKERNTPVFTFFPYVPRYLFFIERVEQLVQQAGLFFALKTSVDFERQQLSKQSVRFVQSEQPLANLSIENDSCLLLNNSQPCLPKNRRRLNHLFTFHELIKLPFCFDLVPTNVGLQKPTLPFVSLASFCCEATTFAKEKQAKVAKATDTKPNTQKQRLQYQKLIASQSLIYLNYNQINILPVTYRKKLYDQIGTKPLSFYKNQKQVFLFITKQKTIKHLTTKLRKSNYLNQKAIFIELLTKKATRQSVVVPKTGSMLLCYASCMYIVCLKQLWCWQQTLIKINQLMTIYEFTAWVTNITNNTNVSNSESVFNTNDVESSLIIHSKKTRSILFFLNKRAQKTTTIRSAQNISLLASKKPAWLAKKQYRLTNPRLSIIYIKTKKFNKRFLRLNSWFKFYGLNKPSFFNKQNSKLPLPFSFGCLFGSCFNLFLFKTRYYKNWSTTSKYQINNAKQQQWRFNQLKRNMLYNLKASKKQSLNDSCLRKNKGKGLQKKRRLKLMQKVKTAKPVVELFVQSWFNRNIKKFAFTKIKRIPVIAYAYVELIWPNYPKTYMQKLHEDRLSFSPIVQKSVSLVTTTSLLFLSTPYKSFVDRPIGLFLTSSQKSMPLVFEGGFSKPSSGYPQNITNSQKKLRVLKTKKRSYLRKRHGKQKLSKKPIVVLPVFTAKLQPLNQCLMVSQMSNLNQLNPFGWVSLMRKSNIALVSSLQCSGKAYDFEKYIFQTSMTRQTYFSVPLFCFDSTYDPWFFHRMNKTYFSSNAKVINNQSLSMIYSIKQDCLSNLFVKHINTFFYEYLETGFFNQNLVYSDFSSEKNSNNKNQNQTQLMSSNQYVSKQSKQKFIKFIAFYTQAVRLKIKKQKSKIVGSKFQKQLKNKQIKHNGKVLNNYIRLIFLKKAKLPSILIIKKKTSLNFAKETLIQKRLIMVDHQSIYFSKNSRYQPSLVLDSIGFKKSSKKQMKKYQKKNIQLITKKSYILTVTQKISKHVTGDLMLTNLFKLEKFKNLSTLHALPLHNDSNVEQQSLLPLNKKKITPPLCQAPYFFDQTQLNSYQMPILNGYFNPMIRSFLKQNKPKFQIEKHTKYYFKHHLAGNACLQLRFDNQSNFYFPSNVSNGVSMKPFAKLTVLSATQLKPTFAPRVRQGWVAPRRPPLAGREEAKQAIFAKSKAKVTEVSTMKGEVIQCFTLKDKTNTAIMYQKEIMRLRYKQESWIGISYLTNKDIITYKFLNHSNQQTLDCDSETKIPWSRKIGSLIAYGEKITETHMLAQPGQIIYLTKTKLVLRRAQCFLLSSGSECNLTQGEYISLGSPLLTVSYSNIQTEDIIQGIPKIDQLFEARTRLGSVSLKQLLERKFLKLKTTDQRRLTKRKAMLESIEYIQKYIVDAVQTVYQSQGVTISDKHVEVIVKQMTSKVQVYTALDSGFLRGDMLPYHYIELLNLDTEDKRFECEPVLLGITQASLRADGFLSAASFQETVRILSQASVLRKVDFLKGLKENIIVGHLLPAGTGLTLPNSNDKVW